MDKPNFNSQLDQGREVRNNLIERAVQDSMPQIMALCRVSAYHGLNSTPPFRIGQLKPFADLHQDFINASKKVPGVHDTIMSVDMINTYFANEQTLLAITRLSDRLHTLSMRINPVEKDVNPLFMCVTISF